MRLRFAPHVVAFFALYAIVHAAVSPAIELARAQFVEFQVGSKAAPGGNLTLKDTNEVPPDATRALEFARSLRADGSWAGIDYSSPARSGWPPAIHYTRMLAMAAAARRPGIPAADSALLVAEVHRAFGYWIAHDFTCPNWWYNQIGAPKLMATTALLLGDQLTAEEGRYLADTMMPRAKIGMTGQNRIWLAGNTLMFGLLTGSESTVRNAAAAIWHESVVTTDEGIQPDFSFHQHGPQQQFGNYGMAFAVEICRWGTILRGTPWSLTESNLAAYRGFLLDGEAWVNWQGRMDISACGRQFMPRSPESKARTIAQVMRNVALFDREKATAYLAAGCDVADATNTLIGQRVFWRSDYVVRRAADWAATLKMSSKRVVGAESLNSENFLGYHLADGALYLYARGDEYDEIFPVWDWQKLPGVTCAQRAGGPPSFREVRGTTDFVGGVTDDATGCAAFDFSRDGVRAHKAWFFTRDAIVCLGAAIASSTHEPVVTTINQCLLRGEVVIKCRDRAPAKFSGDEKTVSDVEWLEHDGWRYAFFAPTTVHVRTSAQRGNWKRVFDNPETPRDDLTLPIFALWLDHGAKPENQSYAYMICRSASNVPPAEIENTDAIQAVRFEHGPTQVVFWTPGATTLSATKALRADQPCLVAMETDGRRVYVADPTQTLTHLSLTVDGRTAAVKLPAGGMAGSSAWVDFAN